MSTSAASTTALVIGASGFLGSHVTRQLVHRGTDVRVMLRPTSSTRGIDDLDVVRHYGDIFDDDALRGAMAGCDVVYYCVVDARMWLRDPAPLFRTNVEGLRHVLDVATGTGLRKFVFTSTTGTLGINTTRAVTEDDLHNWSDGGPYIASRVAAENLVLDYARTQGLPAVALCISTTYGPGDWQPTPHGSLIARVVAGRFPFYFDFSSEVVGIEDAARAMLLAADHGRAGQRYIISDRYMHTRDVHQLAAQAVGMPIPRIKLPLALLYIAARFNDLVAKVIHRDLPFAVVGLRMAELMSPLDHGKAERELGWTPQPVEAAIEAAARFFRDQRQAPNWRARSASTTGSTTQRGTRHMTCPRPASTDDRTTT
ncbi:NAD-dependent epimerase/dehydratase family protein [Mycolicibacterium aubagnense]|uniref:Epimerase n=1 Tax=Mycolicibacterium aubagnense TaxID=319707 RepID=A0ABN5YVB8_9MYCO|nr:NAD-dependent epimerase/dehydratase family protein [Mycolicibacterium aubagnense]TLH50845.1 NAD-dependent dehydratase [Mycolicibacterium aubagnense]WGI33738.1 NAD-dependent epimerase/dehydratase family protein [Mycolicibacterium aubagnense]BBX84504.1 epimerase [Mycolicibacterium aubagnense]